MKKEKNGKKQEKKRGPKGPSKFTPQYLKNEAKELVKFANSEPLPFLSKFAVERGYHRQALYEMANKSRELSDAIKIARSIFEYKIVGSELARKKNPAMAIFALKNVCGWVDKVDHEHKHEKVVKIFKKIEIESREPNELLADVHNRLKLQHADPKNLKGEDA